MVVLKFEMVQIAPQIQNHMTALERCVVSARSSFVAQLDCLMVLLQLVRGMIYGVFSCLLINL